MSDAMLAIVVIVLALVGVSGIAYSLDVRRRKQGPLGPSLPPPGHIGRRLWQAARLLVGLMLLAVLGMYLVPSPAMGWLLVGCLVLFFVDHTAYRVVRLTGK